MLLQPYRLLLVNVVLTKNLFELNWLVCYSGKLISFVIVLIVAGERGMIKRLNFRRSKVTFFKRSKEQSGDQKFFSWDWKLYTFFHLFHEIESFKSIICDFQSPDCTCGYKNYFDLMNFRRLNLWSTEKWQNNSISWSKKLSISCFNLLKFDLLNPTLIVIEGF